MGQKHKPLDLRIPIGKDFKRKRATRLSWIPATFTDEGTIVPVEYHGSAHINGLGPAQALMAVPIGVNEIKKGEIIHVRQI